MTIHKHVEIGHGSILIRHPSSIARDEESEASSLSVDNKQCLMNEAYSFSSTIPIYSDRSSMNFSSHGVEKIKNSAGQIMQQEKLERHVFPHQFTVFHYSSQLCRSINIIKKFHFVYSWPVLFFCIFWRGSSFRKWHTNGFCWDRTWKHSHQAS